MSYMNFLESELTYATDIKIDAEEKQLIQQIFDIINKQGHSGGSMSILNSYLSGYEKRVGTLDESMIFRAADITDGLIKDAFQVLDGLTIGKALKLTAIVTRCLAFAPLSPVAGGEDEWFSICDSETQQNRRMSGLFRAKDGQSYWLDKYRVDYPKPFGLTNYWMGFHRRGFVELPVPTDIATEVHKYTDESLAQKIVLDTNPDRGYITNQMLRSARGIDTTTILNVDLEAMDLETAETTLELAKAIIIAQAAELGEENYPGELLHNALSQLHYADYIEKGEDDTTIRTYGDINFQVGQIRNIMHAISMLPYDAKVDFVGETGITDALGGRFEIVPVMVPGPGFVKFREMGRYAIRWTNDLTQIKEVYIMPLGGHKCYEIAGDVMDWLWCYRRDNGLEQPRRCALEDVVCCENPEPDADLTDAADVIEDESQA